MTVALRKEDHVSVSTAFLEVSEIAAMVADPRAGAISTFSGTTRDNHFGESPHRVEGAAVERGLRLPHVVGVEGGVEWTGLEPVPH